MNFDLRLPIGILFTFYGLLLVGYGLASDPKLYERSLNFNINLAWGWVLLVFGAFMLGLSFWSARRGKRAEHRSGG